MINTEPSSHRALQSPEGPTADDAPPHRRDAIHETADGDAPRPCAMPPACAWDGTISVELKGNTIRSLTFFPLGSYTTLPHQQAGCQLLGSLRCEEGEGSKSNV